MLQVGQLVRIVRRPPWVDHLPPDSQAVFEFCLGRCYRIAEIDHQGLFVLDVSRDVDAKFGGQLNDLRVESEFLEACPDQRQITLLEVLSVWVVGGLVGWIVVGNFGGFWMGGGIACVLFLVVIVVAVRNKRARKRSAT